MTCSNCRKPFDPDRHAGSCAGCSLTPGGCGRVRCPHCGYENQRPLGDALKRWKTWFREMRRDARR